MTKAYFSYSVAMGLALLNDVQELAARHQGKEAKDLLYAVNNFRLEYKKTYEVKD